MPALIDVDLTPEGHRALDGLRRAVAAAAPRRRVDDNGQWLAPLASLIGALKWLAAGLVLLMVGATAATVVLAARAALDTHRATIEVLHLMGATDVQVARLFQRRIALDALFGGLVGFILAALVLIGIGERVSALGSELLGSAACRRRPGGYWSDCRCSAFSSPCWSRGSPSCARWGGCCDPLPVAPRRLPAAALCARLCRLRGDCCPSPRATSGPTRSSSSPAAPAGSTAASS